MTTSTTSAAPRLAATYGEARAAILAAGLRAGADTTAFVHPSPGRLGEELAIDVLTMGPHDADSVLVIVSGTHGVEGFAGSALQRWWLDRSADARPEGVRVTVVHALNPVGFSWVRRVNEDNVDLNRNFVDWSSPPRNDAYAGTLFAMAAFLGDAPSRRMLHYTGDYTGDVPDCLNATPPVAAEDNGWDAESHLAALPAERRRVARLVIDLAPTFQISPRFALAIAMTESNLDPAAVSVKNAMGVMQLIPDTALRFHVRDPFDPIENVKGGLAYLRWLLAYFRGDLALVAAGYNAGEGAVDKYRGVPPYPETRAYVARILAFVARRNHPFDGRVVEPSPAAPISAAPVSRPRVRGDNDL